MFPPYGRLTETYPPHNHHQIPRQITRTLTVTSSSHADATRLLMPLSKTEKYKQWQQEPQNNNVHKNGKKNHHHNRLNRKWDGVKGFVDPEYHETDTKPVVIVTI